LVLVAAVRHLVELDVHFAPFHCSLGVLGSLTRGTTDVSPDVYPRSPRMIFCNTCRWRRGGGPRQICCGLEMESVMNRIITTLILPLLALALLSGSMAHAQAPNSDQHKDNPNSKK
jgi:hypothetical protein